MSESSEPQIPTFAELEADPEIAALLDFEPVPRQVVRPNGWSPERQRKFIAFLAHFGVPKLAADATGKNISGVTPLYRQKGADSFRASWDGALALHASRHPPEAGEAFLGRIPGMGSRRLENRLPEAQGPLRGEYDDEDEAALRAQLEDARDAISAKLLRCRRMYLMEISGSPGKRAAFEILTEFPIDWERAARLEPQDDEPWRIPSLRGPDMLLTAENGWMGGLVHGPDKMAELRQAMDKYRAKLGLDPVDWDESGSAESDPPPP